MSYYEPGVIELGPDNGINVCWNDIGKGVNVLWEIDPFDSVLSRHKHCPKLISHDIKIKIKEYKNIVINNTAHYYNIEDQKKILNDVERLQILPFLEKLPNLNNILTYNSVMCEDICDLLKKNIGNKIIINK